MATASLGRLTLDLVAQIGQFVEPMNRAERKAKESTDKMGKAFSNFKDQMNQSLGGSQFGSALDGVLGKVDSLRGGVLAASGALAGMAVGGTALAIGGLAKMSIDAAKADAQMAMLANRAQIGIENFQIMTVASQQLGISQDQLGSIFADVQEKLGEFSATGGGGAADFFDALKNNTKMTDAEIKKFSKTLQGKDGVAAVQLLKNKLDEVGASSQEQRFVFESLGSDLGNLLPLFANGGKVIDEYGVALNEAGVIKSQEAIQQSQLLAAQTQAINLQFQGAKNQLISGFMPALTGVADAMFGTSKNGLQLTDIGSGLGTIFKFVASVAIGAGQAIKMVGQNLGGVAAIAVSILSGDFRAVPGIAKNMLADTQDSFYDFFAKMDKMWNFTGTVATTSSNKLVNASLALDAANIKTTSSLKTNTKEAEENAKAKEAQAKAIAKATKEQSDLNKMVGASALSGLRIKSAESIAGGQVKAYTANFAQMAQSAIGSSLTRFTAFNDSYHKGTNSKHATGNAFDFTIDDAKKSEQAVTQLEALAKRYGFIVKVLDEYKNPSSRATGGHIHVSVLGYKGSADALKEANAELDIVKKANEEAIRIRDERAKQQLSVASRYATEEQLMAADNEQKIKDINLAFAGDKTALDKYLKLQADAYQKDVEEYKSKQMLKSISDKKALLEVQQYWMSAEDYAREYYALVREEILNTAEYSPEMKNALVKQANIQQGVEENSKREQVWSDYQSMMGLEKSPYQQDIDLLAEARAQMLITEEEYQQQRLGMQMAYGAQYGADFAGMMMGLVDSSSSAYALLGGIQKGAALFSTAMNSYAAISAAWASAPFPYNLPAVGIATMETGLLQAAVSALSPVGYASGGYTGHGGKYDPAGIVHRGEGVLTQEEIAALGGPAGFYALRQSIKNGFADGGLVLDAPKLESPRMAATPKYLGQPTTAQNAIPQSLQINNILDPNIVGDFMGTSSGTKTFMNFIKNNRSSIKAMIA